jgi:hypothetical protein
LLTDLDLTDTTHVKIGGGYEWLEWDDTEEDDNRWTFSAEAAQQLGDVISLTGNVKLGASEFVYGGGLAFDLSNGGMNTNTLAVNYSYIDGKNGIEDDQRVELSWSIGFGAGPTTSVSAADLTDKSGTIRAAADVAIVSPANNLLTDVMKRPAFLPERVLARASVGAGLVCDSTSITYMVVVNETTETTGYDSLNFYARDFSGSATAVFALFPSNGDTVNSPTSIEVYVNGIKYTSPYQVYGNGDEFSIMFKGNVDDENLDPNVFSNGDVRGEVRVVFNTGDACFEITDVIPPANS